MSALPPPPSRLPPVEYDGALRGFLDIKPFWVRWGTGWPWARLSFDQHELVMGDRRHSLRAGRDRVHEIRVSRSGWVKVRFCDGVAPKLRFRGQHPAKITRALRERGWPVVEEADPSGSPEPNRR